MEGSRGPCENDDAATIQTVRSRSAVPRVLFRNSVILVTLNGEKFVALVRQDKFKYPGHKDRMWQILISPYKFRSPAMRFPEDEQERYAKDLLAISKEVHAVLIRTPTVRRLRWWFVGWDMNQPGVRTPAELPWHIDCSKVRQGS